MNKRTKEGNISQRRSIEIEGATHGAPIPMGSQINNIIYSSAITGKDIETGKTAEGGQAQVRVAFANLRKFLDAADATPNDVIRLTVTLADFDLRQFIDEEWLQMFPDATSRPARHVSQLQAHHSEVAVELQVVVVTSN